MSDEKMTDREIYEAMKAADEKHRIARADEAYYARLATEAQAEVFKRTAALYKASAYTQQCDAEMKRANHAWFQNGAVTLKAIEAAEAEQAAKTEHASDCAVHNEPAFPNEPCNCGAEAPADQVRTPDSTSATVTHEQKQIPSPEHMEAGA